MSRINTHVKKGDLVEVTTGAHKGSQGHILQVLPQKGRVLIEGVRMIKKSVRPTQDKPQGGFAEREGAIHISNVKLVESKK
jgi:large subunit ribosomal protein L24